jgi:hypothetical protein
MQSPRELRCRRHPSPPLCRPLGACSDGKPARADAAAGQLVHAPAESGELAAWLNQGAADASPRGSTGRVPGGAAQPRAAAAHGAPGAEDGPRTHAAAQPRDTWDTWDGPGPADGLLHGSAAGQPGGGRGSGDAPATQAGRPGGSAADRPRPLEAHACGAQAGALACSAASGLPLPGGRDVGAAQDGLLGGRSPAGQRAPAAEDASAGAAAGAAAGEGLGGLLAYLDSLEAPHACPALTVGGPATAQSRPPHRGPALCSDSHQ